MLSLPDLKEKQIVFFHAKPHRKLQFSNENLVLRDVETRQVENRVSCHKIFALFLIGDMTLTSVLLRKSSQYGFTVVMMTRSFRTYGVIGAKTEGNYLLRRKQYSLTKSLAISKHIVKNKVSNQIRLLKKIRSKKEFEKKAIETLERYDEKIDLSGDENSLLGLEGYCSKIFFQTYFKSLDWKARRPRTKCDIINLLLDIGYTYIFHFVESHLRLYGFDLYMGVYHKAFYERKSLVCDLVEAFRCLVDSKIRKAYALKQIHKEDFFHKNNQYNLKYKESEKYTRLFAETIMEYKEEIFKYSQAYYRSFIREKKAEEFPVFLI